jgi:TonB-linked SusC/RagA family outer membrane protein
MKKILLLCFSFVFALSTAWAQERVVTGKVSATEDGSSLPGVNVVLKGTTNGTVTDSNGSYKLNIPSSGGSLVFSFIGLQTQEIPIGERNVVDVGLALDVQQLSEVVVTGTGIATDKKKLAISVESVAGDKLPQTPTASIDQALIGKIAGAQISSVSGNPGDPVSILLRGINTVQGSVKPMILVDGVQLAATDLNSLDLSNVERIEVVQGAASASIYGAQGANGVIQIFTKKGKKGKLSVNLSSSYAANTFLNVGDVHKAKLHPYLTDASGNIIDVNTGDPLAYTDYGAIEGLSYKYGGGQNGTPSPAGSTAGATRYAVQDIRNVADQPYNGNLKYYDHFKQVFGTGTTVNNSLSLSGGGEKSDFSVSIANNKTKSPVLVGDNGGIDRTNLTVNLGFEIAKGLKLRSVTQAVYTQNDLKPGLGAAGWLNWGKGNSIGDVSRVYGFLNTSPFFDLKWRDSDGNTAFYQVADFVSINSSNPFYNAQYSKGKDTKTDIIQNFEADYTINKFFQLNAKYGLNYRTENARWTDFNQSKNQNSIAYDPNYIGAFAPDNTGEIDNFQYQNIFQNFIGTGYFRTDLAEDFGSSLPIALSTQVGFDYRKKEYKEYDTYGVGLPTYPPFNLTSTKEQHVWQDLVEPFVTYGYLVDQKVDWGDIGGISGGFRSDYSSAFGQGSKPFTFPHGSGYVSASELWKSSGLNNVLPYFKIRAAYGKAGIQPGPFDRYPVRTVGNLGTGFVTSLPTAQSNPNLRVEVSTETEVGTDFTVNMLKGAFLKSLNGSFTYWTRTSDNVIYTVSTPLSSGTTGILNNAIGLASNGVQLSLNLPVYAGNSFKWDFTTNWGHQISKVKSIGGGADIILTSSAGSTSLVLTPGAPIGQIYGYQALRSLDDTDKNGNRYIAPADESKYTITNGLVVKKSDYQMQFKDYQVPIMNPNPKFNASFINSVSYKNFLNLSFQFDWVYKSHLYNQTKEWMYRDGISGDFEKSVNIDGNVGAYQAFWSSAYYNLWGSTRGAGNNATKDFFVEDASFMRLRNVSLSFDAANAFHMKGFKKLQLVLTGRNLLTFTKYTGYDPEVSSGTPNSAFDRGVDHSTLPNTRSYQIGLNIGL